MAVSANRLELLQIADAVAREKSIDKEIVIEAIEEAIQKGARSRYGAEHDIRVRIDPKTGETTVKRVITVIDDDAVFENDHHVFSRSHPLIGGKVNEEKGIPYLGAGAWSVQVRPIDEAKLKKRPWIAKALAVNHLYVVEIGDRGWSAEAKTADGEGFDRIERVWRR